MFSLFPPQRRFLSAPLLIAFLLVPLAALGVEAPTDIALAVVYDTSGSMLTPIPTADGRLEPKHVIARRALALVIERLERFTQPPAEKRLDLTIVVFDGTRPLEALPMGPLRGDTARRWLSGLRPPSSSTPLGDAMALAGRTLLATPAITKHLLVLTDGENTTGSTPLAALTALRNQARDQPLFVHVLALDISPSVFASLQKAGATLIGAADEKQLQSQLDFILETQILVEAP